jgi:hypothetical protein
VKLEDERLETVVGGHSRTWNFGHPPIYVRRKITVWPDPVNVDRGADRHRDGLRGYPAAGAGL